MRELRNSDESAAGSDDPSSPLRDPHRAGTLVHVLTIGVVTIAFLAVPALAIIGGTLDSANQFSNVGLVTLDGFHYCSGTLYRIIPSHTSSNLFLTAGHCTLGQTGQFKVTFDPAGDTNPSAVYYSGTAYTIPSFAFSSKHGNSLQNGNNVPDAGVIVLDQNVPGITPADLPSLGLVDTLNFKTQLISTVGYGINNFSNAKSSSIGPRYYRNVNITPGQRAGSSDLYLKTETGTCFGDSGGPNFLKGTDTIIGVTSWGQSVVCSDHSYVYRIDSSEALTFLDNPAVVGVH